MAEIETLGILEDIESLVSDKLQVVSYKWLSRSYLVSSDAAKRLLQEFVEKNESELQVVYALSGWLKNDPPSYHIRLVSGSKLSEAKQAFDDTCSIQVYSVQASIPKDSAALWNAEFVQSEELFRQPFAVDNCLRDNRFCGISNSFIKRNMEGMPVKLAAPQPKSAMGAESIKSNTIRQNVTSPQPQKNEIQKASPNVGKQIPVSVKEAKDEVNGPEAIHRAFKPPANKENVPSLPANKKRVQGDKTPSGTGGSLANLWGRVPTKSNLSGSSSDVNPVVPNTADPVPSAEAQVCAHEALEDVNSDDDGQDVIIKRTSNEGNRKRRVFFDFSDDEDFEDAVSLASPENSMDRSCLALKQNVKLPKEMAHLNNNKQLNDKPKIKEETTRESNQSSGEGKECHPSFAEKSKVSAHENNSKDKDKLTNATPASPKRRKVSKIKEETTRESNQSSGEEKECHPSLAEKNKVSSHENNSKEKDKPTNVAPASPKRRKVLRTRIDERGREVNEVVWEGEEAERKKDEVCTVKKPDHHVAENTTNRPSATTKKSPVVGNSAANPTVKAGAKKGGNTTGPKQGNILSFFKRA